MPNRILKESVCTSDNLDALTPFQETFFYRLIVNCDDFGRMDARPKILAAKLFPLKRIRPGEVEKALAALAEAELVILYQVGGRPFLQMRSWERHQQIRAKMSRYPAPGEGQTLAEGPGPQRADGGPASNDDGRLQVMADDGGCSRNPIQEEINPNTKEKGGFAPPTADDVRAYCLEKDYQVDPDRFCDFYASKGWKVGNQPMKDWRAAVRSWARRDKEGGGGGASPGGKVLSQQQYQQREYQNNFHAMDEMMKNYGEGG